MKKNAMKYLHNLIKTKGKTAAGGIIRVDCFLNHMIDPVLIEAVADAFYEHFSDKNITKVITIESSGIAIGILTALKLNVPLVFVKKKASSNISNDVYTTTVRSYTKNVEYQATVAKEYLNETDRVLIVDDFLATGEAVHGMLELIGQAGGEAAGVGIVVEKGFQNGGKELRNQGIDVLSLAIIDDITDDGSIVIR